MKYLSSLAECFLETSKYQAQIYTALLFVMKLKFIEFIIENKNNEIIKRHFIMDIVLVYCRFPCYLNQVHYNVL